MKKMGITELEQKAKQARALMVEVLVKAGCGHPGGAFSSIDVMTALYFGILNVDPANPRMEDRDRFILSKGHSSIGLYTTLCLRGFINRDTLFTFRQDGSLLCGHPDMNKVSGVEMSTGSLGHGLSVGIGMAYAAKLDGKGYRTFVLMGDGETQEGSVWEAAMSASQYKLDNLVAIIDRNRIQIDGFTKDVMSLEPYRSKWESFGWEVREINGNDMGEVMSALEAAPFKKCRPSLILANTIKGKGISFMENNPEWHGKAIKGEFIDKARKDCNCA